MIGWLFIMDIITIPIITMTSTDTIIITEIFILGKFPFIPLYIKITPAIYVKAQSGQK